MVCFSQKQKFVFQFVHTYDLFSILFSQNMGSLCQQSFSLVPIFQGSNFLSEESHQPRHGLRTPREEIAFTARPKIQSQSQIFRYGRSIFCLPHRPNFSDIFDLCLHWVSVVRGYLHQITNDLFNDHMHKGQSIKQTTYMSTQ